MRQHRSNYLLKVVPESTKQGTATALIQDLLLIARPWSFDVASIPEAFQSKIHIWHGTGDLQVSFLMLLCVYCQIHCMPDRLDLRAHLALLCMDHLCVTFEECFLDWIMDDNHCN